MLSRQIESLRRKMGWSQAELAHRLHISPSAVGMYEQGRREPSIEVLVALSKEFDVTIDYLVTGTHCTSTISEVTLGKELSMEFFSMLKKLSREELIVLLAVQMMGQ